MTPAEQKDAEANGPGLKEIKSEVSSDSSSEDIPPFQKRSRRKECIYITIAVVLGAGLIAVLVYFSVTNALKEDDPVERKSTGDDMPSTTEDYGSSYSDYQSGFDDSTSDDYGSAGDPTLFGRQTRGGFVTRDFVPSAGEESVDEETGDPSSMLRSGPSIPQTRMGGLVPQARAMPPSPPANSGPSEGASSGDSVALWRRAGPLQPDTGKKDENKEAETETSAKDVEETGAEVPQKDSGAVVSPPDSASLLRALPVQNLQKIAEPMNAKSTTGDETDKTNGETETESVESNSEGNTETKVAGESQTEGNSETKVADASKTEDAAETQQAGAEQNEAAETGGMPPNIDRSMLLRRLRQPPNPADTTNED